MNFGHPRGGLPNAGLVISGVRYGPKKQAAVVNSHFFFFITIHGQNEQKINKIFNLAS